VSFTDFNVFSIGLSFSYWNIVGPVALHCHWSSCTLLFGLKQWTSEYEML